MQRPKRAGTRPVAASLDAVISQMRAMGMPDLDSHELKLNTGRWERYGPRKKAYYRIDTRVSRAGREYFVGAFGYRGQGPYTVEYEGPQLTPDEIRALEAQRKASQERAARDRERALVRAANDAATTWSTSSSKGFSPYLQRKKIHDVEGWVRFMGLDVVVPMCRYDQADGERLKGVQIIRADGEKRFTAGMAKAGTAVVIGLHQFRQPILIAEGLATAASCWLALGKRYRAFCAFDAGNLLPAARVIRELHPDARLLFCADDDFATEGNPGRVKARIAAEELGRAGVVFPIFRARGDRKLTDFNDLHCDEGLDEVAAQLTSAVKWLPRI